MTNSHELMGERHLLVELTIDRHRADESVSSPPVAGYESMIYSSLHQMPRTEGREAQILTCVFDHGLQMDTLTWNLAKLYPRASYWMIDFLARPELTQVRADYPVALETDKRYHWIPEGSGGSAIYSIHREGSLRIEKLAGAGHMPGFHFLALGKGSPTDLHLMELLLHPDKHPGEIGRLSYDTESVFAESFFEIRPHGEEDREHVKITIKPPAALDVVRQIVKDVYPIPYAHIELTEEEFRRWEDGYRPSLVRDHFSD